MIVAGNFLGELDFGGATLVNSDPTYSYNDVFVAKLDASGDHVWSLSFGDSSTQQDLFDVAVDGAGNVSVVGAFDGSLDFGGNQLLSSGWSAYAASLSPNGDHRWSTSMGDYAWVNAVTTTSDGYTIVGGGFSGTLDWGQAVWTDGCGYVAVFEPGGALFSAREILGADCAVTGVGTCRHAG